MIEMGCTFSESQTAARNPDGWSPPWLRPATNTMPHDIDFRAATGALGGAELTLINPGEQVVIRWKTTRAGVFVYHCAPGGPMTPWHVVSGMNGAVMVLPRDGLNDGRTSRSKASGTTI